MDIKHFKYINETYTIGELKKDKIEAFFAEVKGFAKLDIGLLREFLRKCKGKNSQDIDLYICKKNVSPIIRKGDLHLLHCNGWVLAPKTYNDSDIKNGM